MAGINSLGADVYRGGMTLDKPQVDALAAALGYAFKNTNLLVQALTHSSAGAEGGADHADYERLEFLGDRILGLTIAEALFTRFAQAREGELALRLNALVRRESVAGVARDIGLGKYMLLGVGEARQGGRDKDAILADVCEALIAALYVDGGMAAARGFILGAWAARMAEQAEPPVDAKTALQEWSQARGQGLPDYKIVHRQGPEHALVFTVQVRVGDDAPTKGKGSSKREAEQHAAQAFLDTIAERANG
ncbi:MAG: ribonuclease III [Alphaproteobacteria bacterium]